MNAPRSSNGGPAPLGKKLFQFALIADTHVNEEEHKSTSTYATNAFANGRARFVFESVAALDPLPSFAIHLGDIVHPVPGLPTFEQAVERFKAIASSLRCPLYLIPGNHDVGDKHVEWMPAGTVTASHIEKYKRLFGPDYFAFEHDECRFVALNAQLINSGLAAEAEQRAWFELEARASAGKRSFLFLHYPPYVTDPSESGTYDNIDEPGRSWLLGQISKYRPEGIFAGHVHNFWYDLLGDSAMYLLPATSFLRHDYSELFKTSPVQEFGRNDTSKFGYFLVDVHEHGHVAHFVRTHGATLGEGEKLPAAAPRLAPVHTRTNGLATVGVDLRHPWAELVEIAATGGVQEFERKIARNDYPTLALWEMGVRKLRVPLQDLVDDRVRARMRVLRQTGHEFLVYSYDLPREEARRILVESRGLVTAYEVVLPWSRTIAALPALAELRACSGVEVYVSKLRTHEDAKFDGSRFSHFINHGFHFAETQQIQELVGQAAPLAAIDGLSFRVSRNDAPSAAIQRLSRMAEELGVRPLAHVRLASDSPADAMIDDLANACRVAEAVFSTFLAPRVSAYFDTFMDVDRGYFPRNGFIDRRCNPRLPSRVYANLHAALGCVVSGPLAPLTVDQAEPGALYSGNETQNVVLVLNDSVDAALAVRRLDRLSKVTRTTRIDLGDGAASQIDLSIPRARDSSRVPYLLVNEIAGREATSLSEDRPSIAWS